MALVAYLSFFSLPSYNLLLQLLVLKLWNRRTRQKDRIPIVLGTAVGPRLRQPSLDPPWSVGNHLFFNPRSQF
jgi:hypothetical protein